MSKVRVRAVDSFSHGRLNARPGEEYTVNAADARDLERAGLAKIVGEAGEDDIDELIGAKMAPMVSNKMEPKPENKGVKK